MKKYWKISFVALGIVIAAELIALGVPARLAAYIRNVVVREQSLAHYADQALEACADASYRPSCYDEVILAFMANLSMEEAFEVTRLVQERDRGYWYCHVLGHELSAVETAKDPSEWKTVAARCPSGMCSNGCLHGAFQERFRAASMPEAEVAALTGELQDLCEPRSGWTPTGLEQASCYHALGHLTMYITEADIGKSTALCEEIGVKEHGRDWSQFCFDGAYMQIFQPLEPEDIALVAGKVPEKNELVSYCSRFSGKKRSSCWTEGWPLYLDEITNPERLVWYCSRIAQDAAETARCFEVVFYVLPTQFRFDHATITAYCSRISDMRLQERCFANAASRMIETDWSLVSKAADICRSAKALNVSVGDACFDELLKYSTYNYHAESDAFYNLCYGLPEPWRERCLDGAS